MHVNILHKTTGVLQDLFSLRIKKTKPLSSNEKEAGEKRVVFPSFFFVCLPYVSRLGVLWPCPVGTLSRSRLGRDWFGRFSREDESLPFFSGLSL